MMPPHNAVFPAAGLFASPILFSLFCWPFLVVWVLWASRRPHQAELMAVLGLGITAVALLGCSAGLSWPQGFCLAMEACVPAVLFKMQAPTISSDSRPAATPYEVMPYYLPFLVVGCIFMGFVLHTPLAILGLNALGAVMLAWWDSRATRRAMPAWELVRLRLCGVVLASLGSVITQGGGVFASPENATLIGQILALVGLCMMAGLGQIVSSRADVALLDTGLRFVPLFFLFSLPVTPLMQMLMVAGGLLSLMIMVMERSTRLPLIPTLTGLGIVAVGAGQLIVLLWLYAAALLVGMMRLGCERIIQAERRSSHNSAGWGGLALLPIDMVLPLLLVVLLVVGQMIERWEFVLLLGCMMLGLRRLSLVGISQDMLLIWQEGGRLLHVICAALIILSLLAIGLLAVGIVPEVSLLHGKGV